MSLSCSLSPALAQQQRLTTAQKLRLSSALLQLRTDLISALRGEKYEPSARCPGCDHSLTAIEIRRGFRNDPKDFLTTCPKCKHRFRALLKTYFQVGHAQVPFYCPMQTLGELRGKQGLKPKQIDSGLRQSANYHFGGLTQAFSQIGVTYTLEVIPPWREKVRDFLGQLPDTVIAKIVGVKVRVIQRYRQALKIDRYLASDHY